MEGQGFRHNSLFVLLELSEFKSALSHFNFTLKSEHSGKHLGFTLDESLDLRKGLHVLSCSFLNDLDPMELD